jgi:hypothetical protein
VSFCSLELLTHVTLSFVEYTFEDMSKDIIDKDDKTMVPNQDTYFSGDEDVEETSPTGEPSAHAARTPRDRLAAAQSLDAHIASHVLEEPVMEELGDAIGDEMEALKVSVVSCRVVSCHVVQ